ncbi:MAG: hypothetical protein K2Q21_10580 [Chitinophagaceae bacterium]|nr:hypothetical protein [Chitinophagaceae bacterium]
MIEGKKYIEVVKLFYSFLETDFGFSKVNETINGNAFYDVEFKNIEKVVSISYENIEDYLQVIVFILHNGDMPEYDDKTKTLHLNQLNEKILSKVDKGEISLNNEYFVKFNPKDELEKRLLKSAKELRLCLRHFDQLQVA